MSRTARQVRFAGAVTSVLGAIAATAMSAPSASAATAPQATTESLVQATVSWTRIDPVAKGVNPHGNTHRVGGSYRSVNGESLAYFQSQNQDCAPGEVWLELLPTTPGPYCTPMPMSSGFGSDVSFTYDKRLNTAHAVGTFPIATGFDGIPVPTLVDFTWTGTGDLISERTATRQETPDGAVLVRQNIQRRTATITGFVNGQPIPPPADGTLAYSETVTLPAG